MEDSELKRLHYRRATDLMVAEYSALRGEIVARIEMQYQVLSVTLITSAAFLGLGSQSSIPVPGAALMVYPILAMFLAIAWAYNGIRVVDIGRYLRAIEDKSHGGLAWEHRMDTIERLGSVRSVAAARGVFVITQLLAVALAIVRNNPLPMMMGMYRDGWANVDFPEIAYVVFLAVDVLAVIYTMRIIRQERRASRSREEPMPDDQAKQAPDGVREPEPVELPSTHQP